MRKFAVFAVLGMLAGSALNAGTVIFKDGTQLTDVEIISIADGHVMLDKDGIKKRVGIGKIKAYSNKDIDTLGDTAELEKFADYDITVEVDMADCGRLSSSKRKKQKYPECDIKFRVRRKGENAAVKRVKWPFFYLFVMTSGGDGDGRHPIYQYYYPKKAKYRADGYDQAAIIGNLRRYDRPVIHLGNKRFMEDDSGGKIDSGQRSGREFKLTMKDVMDKRILAWHLEVWGDDSVIFEKDWHMAGFNPRKKWWDRY